MGLPPMVTIGLGIDSDISDWHVTLADTGLNSMTGGRVKRMKSLIGNQRFMLTYGDGLSNIDLKELLKFHKSHGKMVTLTAVRPSARFGDLDFDGSRVVSFEEKPQLHEGWINGGFFVCQPELLDYIDNDNQMLEREPLERVVNNGELMAYKHEGFWHCMDTRRDYDLLKSLWESDAPPWV